MASKKIWGKRKKTHKTDFLWKSFSMQFCLASKDTYIILVCTPRETTMITDTYLTSLGAHQLLLFSVSSPL